MFKKYYRIALILLGTASGAEAQSLKDTLPRDWHLRDANSNYFGISLDKAYSLLKGRKPVKVVAGVIDSGIDTLQEDLLSVLWTNPKEKPGNGKDDDHDGYADDVHGWSFLGSSKGNVTKESLELSRMIHTMQQKGDTLGQYKTLYPKFMAQRTDAKRTVTGVSSFLALVDSIAARTGQTDPHVADFKNYTPRNEKEKQVLGQITAALSQNDDLKAYKSGAEGYRDYFKSQLDYDLNPDFNARAVVGDDPANPLEKLYGCPDLCALDPLHGTHVAGIIAADRLNNKGMMGIAGDVQIMAVRAVPSGDERDKDIANAIRFAADHGAKVINMSFGKGYSPDKKTVDEAVRYALKKDVLLIHAAGNDHVDLDQAPNFPNRHYLDGGEAGAWIEVGASGPEKGAKLCAGFSNYGKKSVDLFAPGVEIWSTLPKNAYGRESGTSMACPVVCGIAALIRSYFPKLKAAEVKDILMRSVIADPGIAGKCITGGVINAAKAVELALNYKKGV